MTPEMFQRARTVFLAAKRLDTTSRQALIEDICDGDGELRHLVDRLLEADSVEKTSVLDEPVFRHPLGKSVDDLSKPKQVGPYRVIRSLGSGSVGDVYLGERMDREGPAVAIKVLRAGAMSRTDLASARFEVERSALSMLSHRNIARIFDAGQTDEGRAFLVMEHVSGKRIDVYCAEHALSRRSRLTLYLQLCDAVQHAHQRGVIHRDLKPANVLVVDEPWPLVKVVDFGIAKIIGDPRGRSPTLTEPGQLLGTFDYMSPEQLDPSRGQADARSDVFALGVILYQLMTDRMPFGDEDVLARRARGLLNLGSIVPMRELPGSVRRDMETIVAKALHPDPEKRYPTPAHLAEDVRRHLAGNPVAARGPSLWYRGSKFLSRHPAAMTAAVVLVGAVLVVALSNLMWRVEVERERRVMRDSILQFMESSFVHLRHLSGGSQNRRDVATGLLAQTDRLLEFRRDDMALLEGRALLLDELSDFSYWDGNLAETRSLREEVLSIRQRTLRRLPNTVDRQRLVAEAMVKIGDIDHLEGDSDAALARYQDAFDIHLALMKEFPSHLGVLDDLCWSYERIGVLLAEAGRMEEVKELRGRRLALAMRLLTLSPDRALSHHNASWAHSQMALDSDDPDLVLSETYLALTHAREALRRAPDRTAFLDSVVMALWRRAGALDRHMGIGPAAPVFGEYIEATDRLAEDSPHLDTFQRRRVTNRIHAAGAMSRGLRFESAATLALEAIRLHGSERPWSEVEPARTLAAPCGALRILDCAARAGVDVAGLIGANGAMPEERVEPEEAVEPASPPEMFGQDEWTVGGALPLE